MKNSIIPIVFAFVFASAGLASTTIIAPLQMNLDEGDYEARLVYVADLGMQEGMVWKGEQKPPAQQIALGFEVVGKTVEIDGVETARLLWLQPFNIYRNLNEKGKELKYYSVFDRSAGDGDDADWEAQLGKVCSINVVHSKGKGENADRVYDNISDVSAIPSKYQEGIAEATLEVGVGNSDETDDENHVNAALYGLSKWIFDRRLDAPAKADPAATSGTVVGDSLSAVDGFDEDIPFK